MRRETVYIAHIDISPRMAEKLASKHGVTADEVREAFELPGKPQRGVWHYDREHGGWRLYVRGRTGAGRRVLGILQPVDRRNDRWRVRTAYGVEG